MKELISLLDFRVRATMNRVFAYNIGFNSQSLFSGTLYAGGTPPDGVWAVKFNLDDHFIPLVDLNPLENSSVSSVKCVRNVN